METKYSVSLSLGNYRNLPAFSFFLHMLLWSSFNRLSENPSLFPLSQSYSVMVRRRMHSLYIQRMPQWIGKKKMCFSVTKSAAFIPPRAWHSWTLCQRTQTEHGHLRFSISINLGLEPLITCWGWNEKHGYCRQKEKNAS